MGDATTATMPLVQPASAALDFTAINAKYTTEAAKRARPEGAAQFEELESSSSERFRRLDADPWVDHDALDAQPSPLKDGDDIKVLILGAGFGGLLAAIRFIQQGFSGSTIRLVDIAGGFGGTWWWNRYPGLMCDTEAYTYFPLLEETGYMPKHKYPFGQECLSYANLLAEKWDLNDKALFRSSIRSFEWDDEERRWVVAIEEGRAPGKDTVKMTVRAQFVVIANGPFAHPHVPKKLQAFGGDVMHTMRFDYGITGGSQEDPQMTKLQGKRVGIVGTGPTAIQLVPELARWAKELYVFQRTPASVSVKGQYETRPEEWKAMTAEPGWQQRRLDNFCATQSWEPGVEDKVNDGWSNLRSFRALNGAVHDKPIAMEDIPGHVAALLAEDVPQAEAIRQRVDEVVQDKTTATNLKAWYPTWCRRPTWHDEYLQTFNRPNVHLVSTDGQGVSHATETGLVAAGTDYPLDLLVLATGSRATAHALAEASDATNTTIRGRDGLTMAEKWKALGPSTLHGMLSNGFPNLFLTGPLQAGASVNFVYTKNVRATHAAYLASEAVRRTGEAGVPDNRVMVEATAEGEELWANTLLQRAGWFAGAGVCGPGQFNDFGNLASPDPVEQMKLARAVSYPLGMNAFLKLVKEWKEDGTMKHVEVSW